MNITEILKKHVDDEGKLNLDAAAKELKEEQGKAYVPKADFNAKNEEVKALTDTVKERDQQLKDLEDVDVDDLKSQITTLTEQNKKKDEEYQEKLGKVKFDSILTEGLSKHGVRSAKAVKALLDMDKIALADDDGELLGFDEQMEALKKSDAYLFDMGKGANYQPNGGGSPSTPDNIVAAMSQKDFNMTEFLKQQQEGE